MFGRLLMWTKSHVVPFVREGDQESLCYAVVEMTVPPSPRLPSVVGIVWMMDVMMSWPWGLYVSRWPMLWKSLSAHDVFVTHKTDCVCMSVLGLFVCVFSIL